MTLEVLIQTVGYPLVFFFIMGESTGVPLPGETAVLVAAGAAGAGKGFNVWLVFTFAAAGAIVGSIICYWIGIRGGRALFARLSEKRWIRKERLDKAEKYFARHGGMAVFLGRGLSYLRVVTSLMAGVSRMSYPRFLLYNALGSIAWAGVVSFMGYKFGRHLQVVETIIREIGWGVLAAIVLCAAVYYASIKYGLFAAITSRWRKDKQS